MRPLRKHLVWVLVCALMACTPPCFASAAAEDVQTIHILGSESKTLTLEEAMTTKTYAALEEMFLQKGIRLDITSVPDDQYATVLQATLASGKLPDFFDASFLDAPSCVNLIKAGKVKSIDDLLAYSDGTASFAFSEDGYYSVCREKDTFEDGKLYYFGNVSMLVSVDEAPFGLHNVTANTFLMKIRKDWLDKLDLPVPTTLDEYFDALVAFREQDANGNGVADERMVIQTVTCDSGWGGFFDNGIAQWFGLANYVFQLDRSTWKVEVPFLQEGFVPYVEFLKKCVDAGVLYLGDNVGKGDANLTSLLAQDVAGSYFYTAHMDMSDGGDGVAANDAWIALPVIQPLPDITPSLDASRGYKSWNYWAFSSAVDAELAAKFLDVVSSIDYSKWYSFGGIEGETYTVENGMYRYIGPNTKEDYLSTGYCRGSAIADGGCLPNPTLEAYYADYKGERLLFSSYDAFLDSSYFNEYFSGTCSEQQLYNLKVYLDMAQKLNRYNQNADIGMLVPMATAEEAEIIDMYRADLYTYMDELFGNLISGSWPIEDMDSYVEQLYALGLQEMIDVYQAQFDRVK